ncbi:MAG: hypothetical protein ACI4DN_03280 [Lachnospiraceae bacterium]
MREEKELEKRQEKLLGTFYETADALAAYRVVMKIVDGFLVLLLVCMGAVPYQLGLREEIQPLLLIVSLLGMEWHMFPYTQFGKVYTQNRRIWKNMGYLPLSRKLHNRFRLKKLFWYCFFIWMPVAAVQFLMAMTEYGEILWGNIRYPFTYVFLLPFLAGSFMLYLCARKA